MTTETFDYSISIDGNDLDAKNAQKLCVGDSLSLERIEDALDTYELVITTAAGKELDMLSYPESVGIAPFLDDGRVKILCGKVSKTALTLGKTHATDKTFLSFSITFEYDPTLLKVLRGSGGNGFLPLGDNFYSLCLYRCLDYALPIIAQTHLNRYEFEAQLDESTKRFFDFDFEAGDYFYMADTIFNESFTQCKMHCKIYCKNSEKEISFSENDAQRFLLLINHYRILCDEPSIENCEIIF